MVPGETLGASQDLEGLAPYTQREIALD